MASKPVKELTSIFFKMKAAFFRYIMTLKTIIHSKTIAPVNC